MPVPSDETQLVVPLSGGLGTLDELFEVTTLIKTQKPEAFPALCLGGEYREHGRSSKTRC